MREADADRRTPVFGIVHFPVMCTHMAISVPIPDPI
jgi:hypothetical protein